MIIMIVTKNIPFLTWLLCRWILLNIVSFNNDPGWTLLILFPPNFITDNYWSFSNVLVLTAVN